MAHSVSHQSQQLLRDSWLTSVSAPSPPATSTSAALRNFAQKTDKPEKEKEIIHSGHFMVSHFEAEAQDDEDTELPDPDESGTNTCTDVVLLPPNQINQTIVTSHTKTNNNAVIDISLAKLFKCMNLAYRWVSFFAIFFSLKKNFVYRCALISWVQSIASVIALFPLSSAQQNERKKNIIAHGFE